MISLETAKKLKELGLEWEPVSTDMYYREFISPISKGYGLYSAHDMDILKADIFAPRLDQLLGEIETNGYRYLLELFPNGQNLLSIVQNEPKRGFDRGWAEDTPDDAAAQALIWIYENREG